MSINTAIANKYSKVLISIIVVAAMWMGFLFGYGGQCANVFSQRILDKSFLVLPVISISIICIGFCMEYRKRFMLILVAAINVLLAVGLFVTISVWTVIAVVNNTDHRLTAISIDISRNIVRVVKLPAKTKRFVAIAEGENIEKMADNKYHIVVYDKYGNLYLQETIRTGEVERVHTITIDE